MKYVFFFGAFFVAGLALLSVFLVMSPIDLSINRQEDSRPPSSTQHQEAEEQINYDTTYPDTVTWNDNTDGNPALSLVQSVVLVSDSVLTLHGIEGDIFLTRHFIKDGIEQREEQLLRKGGSGLNAIAIPGAITAIEDSVLATWAAGDGLYGTFSHDAGKTWDEAVLLSVRTKGPLTPSACIWKENGETHALTAWVLPPQAADGGPLYVREWKEGKWLDTQEIGSYTTATGVSLSCSSHEQYMVFREGSDTQNLHVNITQRTSEGIWNTPDEILSGADPKIAVCGDDVWVAYHYRGTRLAKQQNQDWDIELIDPMGKFESLSCSGDTVVIAWARHDSVADANNKKNARLGLRMSWDRGETWVTWTPDEDPFIKQRSVFAKEDHAVVMWNTLDGALHLQVFNETP